MYNQRKIIEVCQNQTSQFYDASTLPQLFSNYDKYILKWKDILSYEKKGGKKVEVEERYDTIETSLQSSTGVDCSEVPIVSYLKRYKVVIEDYNLGNIKSFVGYHILW